MDYAVREQGERETGDVLGSGVSGEGGCELGGKGRVLVELRSAGFPVPEFVVSPRDLSEAVGELGFPLIVRSSATVEDGGEYSFAGQFESFPGLTTLVETVDAVRRCRESVGQARVIEYCRRQGIDPSAIRMEVIVQRMLEPELAGVAFSVNPANGREEAAIEAVAGVSQELLSGRESPLPASHPLLVRYADEIAALARQVMLHFGSPQEIEFAIADGRMYLLQARPITRIDFPRETGEWTTANFRDGGVSSRVCSALMWSLYDLIWGPTLKGSLEELRLFHQEFEAGRMFFGRPYWNIGAVKESLLRLPGFVEREFDTDLSVDLRYRGTGRTTPMTLGGMLRCLPTAMAFPGFLRRREGDASKLLTDGFRRVEELDRMVREDAEGHFEDLIKRDFRRIESCYFRTVFGVSLSKLDFKRSFPEADFGALVSSLPGLRYLKPFKSIEEMRSRGERDVRRIVREFGHWSRCGIDVIFPRWEEEEESFVEMMFEQQCVSPDDKRGDAFQTVREEVRRTIPRWKRRGFDRKLDRLRRFVWLREELRDLSTRMYAVIRRAVLQIADRRGLGEEIFHMTYQEILADDRTEISRRKETYECYRNYSAPHEIGGGGDCENEVDATGLPGIRLSGIGGSPGVVRGRAWHVRNGEEGLGAPSGSILIAPYIDPGWTPVLGGAAGIVTENGGLLSHAAVICRELGVPAVLGLPEAMRRIRHGCEIVLDGRTGCVEVCDGSGAGGELLLET
ncbi:MAG: hypothetical protein KDA68_01515 [Planctomycetaceae bacterium]|nr:hypothetical protein [Planctomycetaceae bacterium]